MCHSSAEGASKMRYLSETVLTSPNESFLYIFSQKIIFLKIRRALCELCRFVTIVYKRQFRGFPTLQILTFWLQKKNFTKNYWKFEQFLSWNIFCKPARKACYISKSRHFSNITCFFTVGHRVINSHWKFRHFQCNRNLIFMVNIDISSRFHS